MTDLLPIGAHVVVTTARWDRPLHVQQGLTGVIVSHFPLQRVERSSTFVYTVELDGGGRKYYARGDIDNAGGPW